jgi:hypothetical protein
VVLKLPKGRPLCGADDVIARIADAKKVAKHATDHLAVVDGAAF